MQITQTPFLSWIHFNGNDEIIVIQCFELSRSYNYLLSSILSFYN